LRISLVLLINHKPKYNNVDASHRNQGVTTLKATKSIYEEKAQEKEYGQKSWTPKEMTAHPHVTCFLC